MSRLTSAAMFELIIFDMDGVLVDSEDAMAQMTVRALEEWGIHSSPDDFTRFRGMGDRAYVGGVSEMYGVPYEERMKEEAYRLFCENAGELVHVMPWTVPLLCELERRRFACAVASAADRIKVECNLGCIFCRGRYRGGCCKSQARSRYFFEDCRRCGSASRKMRGVRGFALGHSCRQGGGNVRGRGDNIVSEK